MKPPLVAPCVRFSLPPSPDSLWRRRPVRSASNPCLPPRTLLLTVTLALTLVLALAIRAPRSGAAPTPDSAGYRSLPLVSLPEPSGPRRAGFTELPGPSLGIHFTNRLAEDRSLTNQIFLNGSGVAAGDVDGDGWCDLYFCGLDSPNALFRNLGQWRFQDVTSSAGVACEDQASTGAAFADLDGDGDLDLLVNGITRGTRLFLNDGHGAFTEATDDYGLRNSRGSASMALADIDGDGWLDLYVVNYRNDTLRDQPETRFRMGVTNGVSTLLSVNGRSPEDPEILGRYSFDRTGGVLENGEADVLFRNLGGRRFAAVPWTDGTFTDEQGHPVTAPYDWGLSAQFHDLNADGAPDLYVCNDFQSPDRIWINDGSGRFRALPSDALRKTSLFSMGVDAADVDRDGQVDLFVADMLSREHARRQVQVMDRLAFAQFRANTGSRPQVPRNTLLRHRGDGSYAELAQLAGLDASEWSWCPIFLDADLDGFEDLLITTGHWRDAQHADIARQIDDDLRRQPRSPRDQLRLRSRFPRLETPLVAFRNRGDLTFEDAGVGWGLTHTQVAHGMALADLDRDGDLDLAVNCLNGAPRLIRNEVSAPRLAIRLRGLPPNTHGIGARLRVRTPGLPDQSQELIAGGRYLSSDDPLRTFAIGSATAQSEVEVLWRSGRRSLLRHVAPNQCLEIHESGAETAPREGPPPPGLPLFLDVSAALGHEDVDAASEDTLRHPLLPHALDVHGPGAAWFDFTGDGWEDLLIATGRGGRTLAYRCNRDGTFVRQRARFFESPAPRDVLGILGLQATPNHALLALAEGDASPPANPAPVLRLISLADGSLRDTPNTNASPLGPLAAADIDLDGDLDLFVGTLSTPDHYPQASPSQVFLNEAGNFTNSRPVLNPSSSLRAAQCAIFSDFDTNGSPDLILAGEWGPIHILKNSAGRFEEWDPPVQRPNQPQSAPPTRLSTLTGGWASVVTADFDHDGRPDLAAGNWGRNTARHPSPAHPIQMHFGDADGSGHFALLESHVDPASGRRVPTRDLMSLSAAFPSLSARFPTHAALANATLDQVLAADLPDLQSASLGLLDSVVLLNRGD
ncbi:MAG: VCBS repeat-containing protein, partial [Verrucomicrobiales bacterium]|nr:VCBS repeat-containing protein [Verrucomicrobiales bacterium]